MSAKVECIECGKTVEDIHHKDHAWLYLGSTLYCLWYVKGKDSSGPFSPPLKGKRKKIGQLGPEKELNVRLNERLKQKTDESWWNCYTYKEVPQDYDDDKRKKLKIMYIKELRSKGHDLPKNKKIRQSSDQD